MSKYEKKPVETWLNETEYEFMGYMPTDHALKFVNFIKAVNGGSEENESPPVHLVMMERVFNEDRRCAIMCHRGIGKLESPKTPLLTPNGWVTMEDIQVGDEVITREGIPAKISYKTPLQQPKMYEMELSDGTKLEVGDEHNHIVWMHRKKDREKVLTTEQLLERPLYTESKRRADSKSPKRSYTYSIPLVEPIQFPHKMLPQDPYVFGLMLADGYFRGGSISCHLDDMLETGREVSRLGYKVNSMKITSPEGGKLFLPRGQFKEYYDWTFDTKYIPDDYMFSSTEQRQSLLQGLMDGDGSISSNGACTYHSYNKNLAKGVRDLVRSLGGISYLRTYIRDDKNGEEEYQVVVNIKLNPFRLGRKATKWKPTKKTSKAIVAIRAIPKTGGYCIQVDDHTHSYVTRGYTVTHNTTLFAEYLILYMAAFGELPGFGKVNLMLYVTDSIENGVKNLRRNVEYRYQESEFLQAIIPNQKITVGENDAGYVDLDKYEEQTAGGRKFTDIRLEFMNNKGHRLVVKGYGAKGNPLDTILYTEDGYTTIGEVSVGDKIYGPDGKLATIFRKSEVFDKPIYEITLRDGRTLRVSDDHINSVIINTNPNNTIRWEKVDLTTKELITIPLTHTKKGNKRHKGTSTKDLVFIENTAPLEFPEKEYKLDPYTLGVLLGDGSLQYSTALHAHKEDMPHYKTKMCCEFGKLRQDPRSNCQTQGILKLRPIIRELGIGCHGDCKKIPKEYFVGSKEQRLALLQGLMDTDGSIQKTGRMDFASNSLELVNGVSALVRSLGGVSKVRPVSTKAWRTEIWMSICPFSLPRKVARFDPTRHKDKVAIEKITLVEQVPSQCIAIDNDSRQYLAGETKYDYVRTHNTGVRGAKEMGQRPQLAVLDDLISDEDARSATIVETIENTIYKAVSKALHPKKQKMVFIGTPFNANDPLYKAVESGAWKVSVFPICEQFPVSREDFRGSWEDRFDYEYVKAEYDEAMALHKPENFNQELMLRIMSEEDRLIQDDDMVWYSRKKILENKSAYNFYITTDFATSSKKGADYSVISVWAYNNNGDWLLVDGVCKQQLMDKNLEYLFRYVSMYKPLSVGVEITGQQGGFISWINQEMITKNIFFNLACNKGSNQPGIRPVNDKITRFNQVLPLFKQKKIWLPEEMKGTTYMGELLDELTNVSKKGFKSKHDDVSDTISMLSELEAYRPSEQTGEGFFEADNSIWEGFNEQEPELGQSTIF